MAWGLSNMAKLEGYQRTVWPDYHLESEIGHGGYSKVFKAVNLETSQTVAIKISDTINFQSEAQILKNLSQLNHPHIVEFINYKNQDSNQSHNYLVLAYLEGQSLTAYLKNFQNIDFQKIEPIFLQICDAVESLHDLSIFHLDLKPSNIFLIPDDFGGFIAKLIDFGSACDKLNQIDSPNIDSERPIGTPGFISTEQLLEKKSQLNNQNNNITWLLKGSEPIVFRNSLNKNNFITIEGKTPELSIGGSGDVLSGAIAACNKQTKNLLGACVLGATKHQATGRFLASELAKALQK